LGFAQTHQGRCPWKAPPFEKGGRKLFDKYARKSAAKRQLNRNERLSIEEEINMDLMQAFTAKYVKADPPAANVGDTVRVHVRIKEGSRERVQVFEGIVIAKKHGGLDESITVRRISYGVGVEKVFPLHAPAVEKIELVRKGKVRRAKLYYLRQRVGKSAKLKEKL